jgi:hypothetical protein
MRTTQQDVPPACPSGFPPDPDGPVIEHARRNLAWYVLGVGVLTLAGVAWTVAEVRAIRGEVGTMLRKLTNEGR